MCAPLLDFLVSVIFTCKYGEGYSSDNESYAQKQFARIASSLLHVHAIDMIAPS